MIHEVFSNNTVKHYEVFIDGSIDEGSEYRDFIILLRSCEGGDKVLIHLNSGGGLQHIGAQITNAMTESLATVTVKLTARCYSTATFIALAADWLIVDPEVSWLSHTSTYGSTAQINVLAEEVLYESQFIIDFMKRAYNGFHTEEEIKLIATGKQHYMKGLEVIERFAQYKKCRDIRRAKQCED